jgi:hypothetical protein
MIRSKGLQRPRSVVARVEGGVELSGESVRGNGVVEVAGCFRTRLVAFSLLFLSSSLCSLSVLAGAEAGLMKLNEDKPVSQSS